MLELTSRRCWLFQGNDCFKHSVGLNTAKMIGAHRLLQAMIF